MFLKKSVLLFLIAFIQFSFAQKQRKKKVDTIYVYEKVVVYDTVYFSKAIPLAKKEIILPQPEIRETKFIRNIYKEEKDREAAITRARRRKIRTFEFGIEAGAGLKNSSWMKDISGKRQQAGVYGRLWISKDIFLPQLSVMLSGDFYQWNSTFDLDANREETYLDGFYFSRNNEPLLFQKFNNKHAEYALQLKMLYEWKNFRPSAGVLINRNTYTMQFLAPENNVLGKMEDFTANDMHIGFSLGLQYRFFRRILLSLEYQQYTMNNVSLKNSRFDFDIFKTNNTFAERKIGLGISYTISRF